MRLNIHITMALLHTINNLKENIREKEIPFVRATQKETTIRNKYNEKCTVSISKTVLLNGKV